MPNCVNKFWEGDRLLLHRADKEKTDLKNWNLQITINCGHMLPKTVGLKDVDVRVVESGENTGSFSQYHVSYTFIRKLHCIILL